MDKSTASDRIASSSAEEAIARVLDAERAAQQDIANAQQQARDIAEHARAEARAVAERTERRIRRVVTAFEAEFAAGVAQVQAEATRIAQPHVLSAEELAAVEQAVQTLARELTGGAA